MSEPAPQLSLCVITKNEQANLPRCLASVEGLVDEIVVADTGSTDDTVALARQAGAAVFSFSWCDDFAAAYNHALEHARGQWVLVLDADEALLPESFDEVRELLGRDDVFACTTIRRDHFGDPERPDGCSEMLQTRLFRRHPEVRYVGRIHQQFAVPLSELAAREGRSLVASTVRFDHFGYLGDYLDRKHDRSIRLLELELRERPDRFYYLVELGRTRLLAGDPAGLQELARACEQIRTGHHPAAPGDAALATMLEQLLAQPRLPADFPLTPAQLEDLAARHFADAIPLLWQRARRAFAAGRFADAARLLEQLRAHARAGTYSRLCSFQPRILHEDAVLNLGVCYTRLGKVPAARRCFESLRNHPRQGPAARANLNALRRAGRG